MVHFGEFFENLKLAVKQCYQTKLVENGKIQKFKCNETFLMTFVLFCGVMVKNVSSQFHESLLYNTGS